MGLGVSLILIAVGAIMAWAVHVIATGFDLHTIGIILLVVGIIGAVLSMIFWSSWAGPGYFTREPPHLRRRGSGLPRRASATQDAVGEFSRPAHPLFRLPKSERETKFRCCRLFLDEQEGKKLETWADVLNDVGEGQLLWLDLVDGSADEKNGKSAKRSAWTRSTRAAFRKEGVQPGSCLSAKGYLRVTAVAAGELKRRRASTNGRARLLRRREWVVTAHDVEVGCSRISGTASEEKRNRRTRCAVLPC